MSPVVGEDKEPTTTSDDDEHGNVKPLSEDPRVRNVYYYQFNFLWTVTYFYLTGLCIYIIVSLLIMYLLI